MAKALASRRTLVLSGLISCRLLVTSSSYQLAKLGRELKQADPETLSSAPLAPAEAWPTKNGDYWRSGHSLSWAPLELTTPAWTFDKFRSDPSALSYSSPVVDADGNVYISSTANGNAGADTELYSLDPEGKVRWQIGGPGTMAFATPWLQDGTLYTASGAGVAYAIDMATGAVKWETKYADKSSNDGWTVGLGRQTVILGGQGKDDGMNTMIYALDATTGVQKWSFATGSLLINVLPIISGDTVIFSNCQGGLYRLKLSDGQVLWQTPNNGDMMTTGGAVVGPNNIIYATSNDNSTVAYGEPLGGKGLLRAHSLESGDVLWERKLDMEANSAPALMEVAGKVAVIVGLGSSAMYPPPMPAQGGPWPGSVRAFNGASGTDLWSFDVTWKEQGEPGSTMARICLPDAWSNAVTSLEGVVYIGWQGGVVFAINGTTGAEISHYDLHSGIQGEPAIANGALYVQSCDRLVAFKP